MKLARKIMTRLILLCLFMSSSLLPSIWFSLQTSNTSQEEVQIYTTTPNDIRDAAIEAEISQRLRKINSQIQQQNEITAANVGVLANMRNLPRSSTITGNSTAIPTSGTWIINTSTLIDSESLYLNCSIEIINGVQLEFRNAQLALDSPTNGGLSITVTNGTLFLNSSIFTGTGEGHRWKIILSTHSTPNRFRAFNSSLSWLGDVAVPERWNNFSIQSSGAIIDFEDCVFRNCMGVLYASGTKDLAEYIRFKNCAIIDSLSGIYMEYCANITFQNCHFERVSALVIGAAHSVDILSYDNLFYNCTYSKIGTGFGWENMVDIHNSVNCRFINDKVKQIPLIAFENINDSVNVQKMEQNEHLKERYMLRFWRTNDTLVDNGTYFCLGKIIMGREDLNFTNSNSYSIPWMVCDESPYKANPIWELMDEYAQYSETNGLTLIKNNLLEYTTAFEIQGVSNYVIQNNSMIWTLKSYWSYKCEIMDSIGYCQVTPNDTIVIQGGIDVRDSHLSGKGVNGTIQYNYLKYLQLNIYGNYTNVNVTYNDIIGWAADKSIGGNQSNRQNIWEHNFYAYTHELIPPFVKDERGVMWDCVDIDSNGITDEPFTSLPEGGCNIYDPYAQYAPLSRETWLRSFKIENGTGKIQVNIADADLISAVNVSLFASNSKSFLIPLLKNSTSGKWEGTANLTGMDLNCRISATDSLGNIFTYNRNISLTIDPDNTWILILTIVLSAGASIVVVIVLVKYIQKKKKN